MQIDLFIESDLKLSGNAVIILSRMKDEYEKLGPQACNAYCQASENPKAVKELFDNQLIVKRECAASHVFDLTHDIKKDIIKNNGYIKLFNKWIPTSGKWNIDFERKMLGC